MIDEQDDRRPLRDDQIHELKNRLTVVRGMTQLIERHVQRADWERDEIIDRIDRLNREFDRIEALLDSYGRRSFDAESARSTLPTKFDGDDAYPNG